LHGQPERYDHNQYSGDQQAACGEVSAAESSGSSQRCSDIFMKAKRAFAATLLLVLGLCLGRVSHAQSPELVMRDYSSGQIKKGVRSIGFGGDGATWGNYGLVWKDAGSALVDYGDTRFTDGNEFRFAAVGATSPALWNGLTIYLIAMSQDSNDVGFNAKSPGLGPSTVPVIGRGRDQALFSKIAMPLGNGVSAGVLLSYEVSKFDATSVSNPAQSVRYETEWRPSGGFGVAWQPNDKLLAGFRALLNTDLERRIDSTGKAEGTARSQEYRLGISVSPWKGGWLDAGVTSLEKRNELNATHSSETHPNLGLEQWFLNRRLALRFGLDETSPTAGLTYKVPPFNLDVVYVRNMAKARSELFGSESNSVIATLSLDYRSFSGRP
jgi:hypothetical protein